MARWRVGLANAANRDFVEVLEHTLETFGDRQARTYRSTLKSALKALEAGPNIPGSASREDLATGLRSLHVARQGRRGRHLLVYRTGPERTIEVLRILHDAMDLGRHMTLPGDRGS